jgi:hypothetical protein
MRLISAIGMKARAARLLAKQRLRAIAEPRRRKGRLAAVGSTIDFMIGENPRDD